MRKQHTGTVVQGVAVVCALLLTLALVPGGAVAASAADRQGDIRATDARTGPSAGAPMDRGPGSVVARSSDAADQNENDCVVEDSVTGDAYPTFFDVTCSTSSAENSTLRVEGRSSSRRDGWAYVVYVELPEDVQGRNEIPGGSIVIENTVSGKAQDWIADAWRSTLNVPEDEIAIVADAATGVGSNGAGQPTSLYTSLAKNVPVEPVLHPGVYEIRVEVFLPWKGGPTPSNLGNTRKLRDDAIANAPRKASTMTVEMGGCQAEFDAGERLQALDRRKLEAISAFFEARREFNSQKRNGTRTAFLGGVGLVSSRGSTPFFNALSDALPTPYDVWKESKKAVEKGQQLNEAAERLKQVEKDRNALEAELERCIGSNYHIPDSYNRLSPADIAEAKRPDGDTTKDES